MRDHYDFSKGVRGKFYRPINELKIPVYLDPQISSELNILMQHDKRDLNTIVNEILRKDLELYRTMRVAE
jgi:hypothetical protein